MKNKTANQIFFISEGILLTMGLIMAWLWSKLPPQLPWFYSLPSGEQQLVNKLYLVFILGGMAILIFLTKLIAKWASKEDTPVENTIMMGGLIATILLAASFFRVMQIIVGL